MDQPDNGGEGSDEVTSVRDVLQNYNQRREERERSSALPAEVTMERPRRYPKTVDELSKYKREIGACVGFF